MVHDRQNLSFHLKTTQVNNYFWFAKNEYFQKIRFVELFGFYRYVHFFGICSKFKVLEDNIYFWVMKKYIFIRMFLQRSLLSLSLQPSSRPYCLFYIVPPAFSCGVLSFVVLVVAFYSAIFPHPSCCSAQTILTAFFNHVHYIFLCYR